MLMPKRVKRRKQFRGSMAVSYTHLVPLGHTRKRVQSPLVVLGLEVRKGGDFFYGKSSNENHFKGL